MKLNVIGRYNAFGNLYALSDDGEVYLGKNRPEQTGLADCQIHLEELEWVKYPRSKAPKRLFDDEAQGVIEV